MTSASAPAKIILCGEHAVVYGQPAIAVPLSSLRATATVTPGRGLTIVAADLNERLPLSVASDVVDNALLRTAQLVLQTLNVPPPDLTIMLHSDIPMASGLGSGAAVSTALARSLSAALGQPLANDALNALIYDVEKLHHGTPSGIDNTIIVYEQPVFFVREQPIERLTIPTPFHLLVADTGKGALTRVAVGDVRNLFNADPSRIQPILDDIGTLVRDARAAIEQADFPTLGAMLSRNHTLLQQLTVSSDELDALVTAALDAGALGAKLSGGGRGGNMIALVTPDTREKVWAALVRAGAFRVFETVVGDSP